VKEWLKSVLNYQSYLKNKTEYPFFWNTLYSAPFTIKTTVYYTVCVGIQNNKKPGCRYDSRLC